MDLDQKQMAEELLFEKEHPPSFAKSLFTGRLVLSSIFPYPCPSKQVQESTKQLLDELKAFMDKELNPSLIDKNAEIPQKIIKGLYELGILSMTIPKEYGGLGLSQYAYCKVIEEIAKRCSSTALLINAHQSIGLKAILLFGTDAQKRKWLPKLTQSESIAAFSLTEPNAGSDASGIETVAVYDSNKKGYVLNGRKQWTTNGAVADILTVMAKTEVPNSKDRKVTAFIVTPNMPGFKVLDPSLEKVGMRGTKTANLAFEDMFVPEENVLGAIGGGLKVCLSALDYGRTTFGAMCLGVAKTALEKASKHAKTRKQFGKTLDSFEMVQKKLSFMAAHTYAIEASTYLTAGLIDEGVEDIMLDSAILKVFASDTVWSCIYESMQIFGGRSFFTDLPLERMMRDARLNMIGEGANEVMRVFIGAVGLRGVGMELKELLDAFKNPFNSIKAIFKGTFRLFKKLIRPGLPNGRSELDEEKNSLSIDTRRFSLMAVKLLVRYREEVIEKQLELDKMAEGAICLFSSFAVLSRIESELDKGKNENLFIAKHYLHLAAKRFKDALDHVHCPLDAESALVGKKVGEMA